MPREKPSMRRLLASSKPTRASNSRARAARSEPGNEKAWPTKSRYSRGVIHG